MKTQHIVASLALVASASIAVSSHARSIRVDSGDWDLSAFTTTSSTQALGFNFDALGVSTGSAGIDVNGGITLAGGETLNLNPVLDPGQGQGGNTIQYQFGTTNANFSAANSLIAVR